MEADQGGPGALAEGCQMGWLPTECGHVLPQIAQHQALVPQASVPRGSRGQGQESQRHQLVGTITFSVATKYGRLGAPQRMHLRIPPPFIMDPDKDGG
ncbi:glyoxalase [Platysternon megacephalum]|uniref:Glyoxalase n=1 Tax=Platysternon megacephalum TaxID=55544 RepID=A0A4D9DNG7_9SAUR|nr:glyoxalase [Platysternon megacephalum]